MGGCALGGDAETTLSCPPASQQPQAEWISPACFYHDGLCHNRPAATGPSKRETPTTVSKADFAFF